MPRKTKDIIVESEELVSEYIEPEILPISTNISKRTGKVKRHLSEKQLAVLAEGRIKGLEARRKLQENLNLKAKIESKQKRAVFIKKSIFVQNRKKEQFKAKIK